MTLQRLDSRVHKNKKQITKKKNENKNKEANYFLYYCSELCFDKKLCYYAYTNDHVSINTNNKNQHTPPHL